MKPVGVRDIYALEFQIFHNPIWAVFYILSVFVFMTHACLGWEKVTGNAALGIPKLHHKNVKRMGYAIFIVIGLIYISFPLFTIFTKAEAGHELKIQNVKRSGFLEFLAIVVILIAGLLLYSE